MSATNSGPATVEATPPDIRQFEIPRPDRRRATVHLVGDSALLMHRWSEKALTALEGSQTGRAKGQRAARDPMAEALANAYIVPGREGWEDKPGKFFFPAPAFKHAFLYGVSQLDDIKKFPKTRTTGWVFIDADPLVDFDAVVMRTDVGRIGSGVQMVYRLAFFPWRVDLSVTYNSATITVEQVASLFDLGGVGGVGDWRPTSPKNKAGDFGRFHVVGVTEEV